jgi:tetratricopeptide (TPR) repeat protein
MTFDIDWKKYLNQATDYIKNDKELRLWGVAAVILVVGGGSYYGYRFVNQQWAQKAQAAFAESYEVYQQALNVQFSDKAKSEAKKELWEQAEIDFKQAGEHNNHSSLASFLKAFQGQALSFEGQRDESIVTLKQAVSKMSNSNPYKGLYEVGLSFMLLDGDEDEVADGIESLSRVANSESNKYQDMALYYLGLYYQVAGEADKAVGYWKQIKRGESVEYKKAESPWARLAQIKLSESGLEKE